MIHEHQPVHHDDALFFNEVVTAMRQVARDYNLTLRNVQHLPDQHASFKTDRWGDCHLITGDVRLLLRPRLGGAWAERPVSPEAVWQTAAHELAHLRVATHGPLHDTFTEELYTALHNVRERSSPRAKLIDKLLKLKAQRDSEASLGNVEAAEAFAEKLNALLLQHELSSGDLEYARMTSDDPIVTVEVNHKVYGVRQTRSRIAWQEQLARVVASAHLCKFLVRGGTNFIAFVGARSHATIAEYTYGTLLRAACDLQDKAYRGFYREHRGDRLQLRGYRAAWLNGFTARIRERLDETRRATCESFDLKAPVAGSLSMVRLSGAMRRVEAYVDEHFKGKARGLSGTYARNEAGTRQGRAAADTVSLTRGVGSGPGSRGRLTS